MPIIIWLIGMLIVSGYFIFHHLKWKKIYKEALPVHLPEVDEWKGKYLKSKGRKIQIKQLNQVITPLTYGIFHPIIILPKALVKEKGIFLEVVLTHEYMHIHYFDVLMKWILAICVSVHWFNPIIWLMYILANEDIELSCDESVVKKLGEDKRSEYAWGLLTLQESVNKILTLNSCFSKNIVEKRVKEIMVIKKKSKLFVVLIAICICVLANIIGIFETNVYANRVSVEKKNSYFHTEMSFQTKERGKNDSNIPILHLYDMGESYNIQMYSVEGEMIFSENDVRLNLEAVMEYAYEQVFQ